MLTLQCVIAGVSNNTLTLLKLHTMSKNLRFILLTCSSDNTVLAMQLIQKVAGRPGAPTFAPAALHQQAPWHHDQTPQPTSYAQPQNGYQAQQSGFRALPTDMCRQINAAEHQSKSPVQHQLPSHQMSPPAAYYCIVEPSHYCYTASCVQAVFCLLSPVPANFNTYMQRPSRLPCCYLQTVDNSIQLKLIVLLRQRTE